MTDLRPRIAAETEASEDLFYTAAWRLFPELNREAITPADAAFRRRFVRLAWERGFVDMGLMLAERARPGAMLEMGRYTQGDDGPAGCFARVSGNCSGDGPRWEDEGRGAGATLALALLDAVVLLCEAE